MVIRKIGKFVKSYTLEIVMAIGTILIMVEFAAVQVWMNDPVHAATTYQGFRIPVEVHVAPTMVPTALPTKQVEAMVATQEADIPTYTYRLDEYGHAIWREAGLVPAGSMMISGPCWPDGFRQVEYRDPARPSRWKVEYMKCIN